MQKYCLKQKLQDIWFITYHVGGLLLALMAGILVSTGTPEEMAKSTIVVYMLVAFWITVYILYILYNIFRWFRGNIEPC